MQTDTTIHTHLTSLKDLMMDVKSQRWQKRCPRIQLDPEEPGIGEVRTPSIRNDGFNLRTSCGWFEYFECMLLHDPKLLLGHLDLAAEFSLHPTCRQRFQKIAASDHEAISVVLIYSVKNITFPINITSRNETLFECCTKVHGNIVKTQFSWQFSKLSSKLTFFMMQVRRLVFFLFVSQQTSLCSL